MILIGVPFRVLVVNSLLFFTTKTPNDTKFTKKNHFIGVPFRVLVVSSFFTTKSPNSPNPTK
jgi:hypothetical protein